MCTPFAAPPTGKNGTMQAPSVTLQCYYPRMFSGGDYEEVARWLWNFLAAHAKRENLRAEVDLEAGEEREGKSYAARVRLGGKVSPPIEFEFAEVARNRGSLGWCATLAARVREVVRDLGAAAA